MSPLLRSRTALILIVLGLILVACGTEATELRPTFVPTSTFDLALRGVGDVDSDGEVVAAVVPTNTPIPPTDIPPTEVPTEMPTEAATEVVEDDSDTTAVELPGDPEIGELLFNNIPASSGQMCITCHNPNEPIDGTGPYQYGIANRAGSRIEGYTAEEYLRESILEPNAYLVEREDGTTWTEGVMPTDWAQVLTDEDVDHIVAYLLTLDQEE